jgi:3-oxoacyl-[acyl-carrier-protein] synthase II
MRRNAPVAITGIGCISAAGLSLKENITSLFAGERHVAPPVRFSSSHPICYPVFEISEKVFNSIPSRNDMSYTSKLGVAAVREALKDAGLAAEDLSGIRVGVCMGTTVGSTMNNEQFYRDYQSGLNPDMSIINRYLFGNPASVMAREFGLSGPCQTVVNACSSSAEAIGLGTMWLRNGLCDVVIAGGTDELCRITYNGFISLMITDDSPCKPYDKDRKGLNLGEGAAVLVLESDNFVKKRNKEPRAFVLGYGAACDGYHPTAPRPDGRGLKNAITDALIDSGKTAGDIAFVHTHGTATRDNDRVESKVLKDMLPGVPFFSTKGYTGHTLGAAGAVKAAYNVAFLESGMVPPNAGFASLDPELGVSPVSTTIKISKGIALSEALAFGGNNAVLIIALERD